MLNLLVVPVMVEVTPVLPVPVTAVAVLELHPWEELGGRWYQLMLNCGTLLTTPGLRVASPASSAARLVLTFRTGDCWLYCVLSTFLNPHIYYL